MGIQTGQILSGRYQVTEPLGKGGQALTFSGFRLIDDLPVVIKALHFGRIQNWKIYELFQRETRILSHLNHPAIPKFLDHYQVQKEHDTWLYLVQEKVPGQNLSAAMEAGWRPSVTEVETIALKILDVLSYLHQLAPPVIHRDLKPSNIIKHGEHIFVVDFGAVQDVLRPEGSSTVVGTFGYMAPEQFSGKALPTTDLYALGATLVHLLSGRTPAELPQKELRLDFKPFVHCSLTLSQWLEKMLEPIPERRFQSAKEAKAALLNPKAQDVQTLHTEASETRQLPRIYRPSASKVQIQRSATGLDIDIPPGGLTGKNIFMAGFATFWLGFVAFWTAEASMGSIFFALFSIPFWIAGLYLARIVLFNFAAHTQLHMDADSYLIREQIFFFEKSQPGLTQELESVSLNLDYTMNNIPVFVLSLETGARKHRFARELSHNEQNWIQNEILNYLAETMPPDRVQRLLALSESIE